MRKVSGMFVTVAILAVGVLAQDPVSFSHEPVGCVSPDCGRASISAVVEASVPLQSVRVYFNNGSGPEYYVEMLHSGDWNFNAILPAVAPGTSEIAYRIVAITETGEVLPGPSHVIPVTPDCAPTALTQEQSALAANTAIGLTDASQSGSPMGFSCLGLVKTIDLGEVMSDNTACEEVSLAKTDPCLMEGEETEGAVAEGAAAGAAAGAVSGKVIAYTAAGVAVGVGVAVIYNNNKEDKKPISRARP